MKKLLCWSLTTLTMLFATVGLASAQTVTFDPPTGSTVSVSTEITISKEGTFTNDQTAYYALFSTKAEAESSSFFASADGFWDGYENGLVDIGTKIPSIDENHKVIRVRIWDMSTDNWVPDADFYAEYTLAGGSETPTPTEVATPTFTPAAGTVEANTEVTIVSTEGASIHYTTDNSTPTASSTKYTAPIKITATTTIKAIAVLDGTESEVAEATYTIKQPLSVTVTFDPVSGSKVIPGSKFTVSGTHNDADNGMFYFKTYATKTEAEADDWTSSNPQGICMNGKSGSREITTKPVIKVAAKIGTGYSEFFYAEYTIYTPDTVDTPKFSEEAGEVPVGTEVEISCDTNGATIYYSVNADTVTVNSTPYTEPISIDSNMTIWAIAVKAGLITSDTAKIAYTVPEEAPEVTLDFTPATGAELEENDTITITPSGNLDDTEILFAWFPSKDSAERCTDETMLNGEDVDVFFYGEPDEEDPQYAYPVFHAEKPVLKAGYMASTTEEGELIFRWFYAEYTLKAEEWEQDTVATPRFNPGAGQIEAGTEVEILCDTAGADIHYTTDGTTPTDKSAKYTAKIKIDRAMTIKAIAVKEGLVASKVAEAAYTLKTGTANENNGLAGVHIYPNPTTGNFKIESPVAARVEIFTTNGIVIKYFTMTAGIEEIRMENSGIYFVRLTSENGSATVKRVVIR